MGFERIGEALVTSAIIIGVGSFLLGFVIAWLIFG